MAIEELDIRIIHLLLQKVKQLYKDLRNDKSKKNLLYDSEKEKIPCFTGNEGFLAKYLPEVYFKNKGFKQPWAKTALYKIYYKHK